MSPRRWTEAAVMAAIGDGVGRWIVPPDGAGQIVTTAYWSGLQWLSSGHAETWSRTTDRSDPPGTPPVYRRIVLRSVRQAEAWDPANGHIGGAR